MKLALLCTSTSRGGLELYTMRLAKSLVERGHEILVISQEGSFLYEKLLEANIKTETVSKSSQYLCFYTAYKCSQILKEYEFNKLLVTNTKDIDLGAFIKSFFIRDIKLLYLQQMQLGIKKKSIYFDWKFSKLDRWYAPLKWLHEEVCTNTNIDQAKIRDIPVTIETKNFLDYKVSKDEARKVFDLPSSEFIFGFVGRIDKTKCPDVVLEAFELLKEKYLPNENISLVVVGNKTSDKGKELAFAQKFEMSIKTSKYKDNIYRFAFIEDVKAIFRSLDVFLMSSHNETIGLVTQEAMALGTLVIGAESGGTVELLNFGKCGYTFKSGDAVSLCEQMLKSFQERDQHMQIKERAVDYIVENFDRKISCEKIEADVKTL